MRRLLVAALALWLFWPTGDLARPARRGLAERLLGPVASLAASVYWVRFDVALRDGQPGRAYALAQRALDLDPGAWQGWSTLGLHLIFDRSSEEVEPDPLERRHWIAAGLEVLELGVEVARGPEELRLAQGLVLAGFIAPRAAELDWPGGSEAALEAGITHLDEARELGHGRAAELLHAAREDLAALRRGERPRGW